MALTQKVLPQSKFCFPRFESVMMITKTSWDELETVTGVKRMEQTAKVLGLNREKTQKAAEYMQCDPGYIFMENNDPKIGEYKPPRRITEKKPVQVPHVTIDSSKQNKPKEKQATVEAVPVKEEPLEVNRINRDRVAEEMKKQGWLGRTMVLFLDVSQGTTSVKSQVLNRKTFPTHTTENLSWLLGVTVEYLCGDTDNPEEGRVGERHETPKDTFLLDASKYSIYTLRHSLGLSFRTAKWLTEEPRMVDPRLSQMIENKLVNPKGKAALPADAEDAQETEDAGNSSKPQEPVVKIVEVKADGQEVDRVNTQQEKERKDVKGSYKPVLALIQEMNNEDLDKAGKLIQAMKEIGTSVSTDDFTKIEMVIETQRDFNNAQKNRLDALNMFA